MGQGTRAAYREPPSRSKCLAMVRASERPHAVAPLPTLREWLREGPFTLTMSSGFFAFYAHTGFFSILEEEGLLPARVSGSSAGALVAGTWAAGVTAEDFWRQLLEIRRSDFWDPALGLGFLAGRRFQERLSAMLPVQTFAECRAPLAVSLFDVRTRRTEVRTSGPLADTLRASCAVPGLFHPVRIDGRLYVDGGVADRPGLAGVAAGERVLFHHIESRSAWRRKAEMAIPARSDMQTVVLKDLPRSGPFALENGRRAFHAARLQTRRALERPLESNAGKYAVLFA